MYNDTQYTQQAYTLGYGPTSTNNPFLDSGDSNSDRWPDVSNEISQTVQTPQNWQQQSNLTGSSTSFQPNVFPGGGNNWVIGPPNPPGWQPPMPQIPITSQYYQLMLAQRSQAAPAQPAQANQVAPATSSITPISQQTNPVASFSQAPTYPQYTQYDTGGYSNPLISQFDPMANTAQQTQQTQQTQSWVQPNNPQVIYDQSFQNTGYQNVAQYPTNNQTPSSADDSQRIHPRDYIQRNKSYLESWDQYHWQQAMNAFESLSEAWSKQVDKLNVEKQLQIARYGRYDPNLDTVSDPVLRGV
jgi:hypothetical protein